MEKRLLKTEKDLYKLLDDIYNIIPDNDISKAIYKSKEEQYEYQKSTFELPATYPCVMIYDIMESNYSSRTKPYLTNKDYWFISDVSYVKQSTINKQQKENFDKELDQEIKKDFDFEQILCKYGPEGMFRIAKLLEEYARKDCDDACEQSKNRKF